MGRGGTCLASQQALHIFHEERMTSFWRAAGLTYVNYSAIAARETRKALVKRADLQVTTFCGESIDYIFVWPLDGKQMG